MEALRQRYGSADYRLASGVMRETLVKVVNESYEAELMRLSAPVRLLWGVADTEVPVGVAERAAAILSQRGIDARLEVVEGASHWLPTEAPATLRRTVDDLLAAP
jgi:pimeloyl-ACP methyl ester carboxylesterase